MARRAKKTPVLDRPTAACRGAARHSSRRQRSRCRRCCKSGGDVAFRETLYLMVLAFGRLYTCREAFGRIAGAHRFAVHRADRNGLPAGPRGRVDPRARRPHPARRDACDHRSRPADRQGPAHQAGQHARPPQRAGAAVAQGRGCDPRGQSAAAARQRPAVSDVSREDFAVVSRFLEKFALNSEYALAEIRRSERERSTVDARAGQD